MVSKNNYDKSWVDSFIIMLKKNAVDSIADNGDEGFASQKDSLTHV